MTSGFLCNADHDIVAHALVGPDLRGPGFLLVLFPLCSDRLFRARLSLRLGLVFLALLVTHEIRSFPGCLTFRSRYEFPLSLALP